MKIDDTVMRVLRGAIAPAMMVAATACAATPQTVPGPETAPTVQVTEETTVAAKPTPGPTTEPAPTPEEVDYMLAACGRG